MRPGFRQIIPDLWERCAEPVSRAVSACFPLMPTDLFARALVDILLTQAPDFAGIYDAAAG